MRLDRRFPVSAYAALLALNHDQTGAGDVVLANRCVVGTTIVHDRRLLGQCLLDLRMNILNTDRFMHLVLRSYFLVRVHIDMELDRLLRLLFHYNFILVALVLERSRAGYNLHY